MTGVYLYTTTCHAYVVDAGQRARVGNARGGTSATKCLDLLGRLQASSSYTAAALVQRSQLLCCDDAEGRMLDSAGTVAQQRDKGMNVRRCVPARGLTTTSWQPAAICMGPFAMT